MESPQVFEHPDPTATLLPLLHPFLPHSLPLYRRIQFGNFTTSTRVLATTPPQAPNESTPDPSPAHFCAAYIDRSRRPETESWLFLPSELPSHTHTHANPANPSAHCQTCLTHMLALLAYAATTCPFPTITSAESDDIFAAVRSTDPSTEAETHNHSHSAAPRAGYLTDLEDRSILKIGSLHSAAAGFLADSGFAPAHLPGVGFSYRKYVFDGVPAATDRTLPPGLRFGSVREADLPLVRSRTAIPRMNRTLRTLPSVALFAETADAPVAWAFLSPDGSLAGLHVEREHRGMGIAKAMGAKLFAEGFERFGDQLGGLAHADVALENQESNGVCKSLGGREAWEVYWIRVDVNKVQESVQGMQQT